MWIAIAVVSGLASLAGYGLFQDSSPDTVAFVLTFAAGAILTMLADTMMPEAYEHGGKLVGVVTTLGFAVAFTIHLLDCVTQQEEDPPAYQRPPSIGDGTVEGPTLARSQSLIGADSPRNFTIRSLARRVPSHAPAGQSRHAISPL